MRDGLPRAPGAWGSRWRTRAAGATGRLRARGSIGIFALALGVAHADTLPVARVGVVDIGADLVEARAARLAPFQRKGLGVTWPEQRRHLLDDVLVPEALLQAASARDDATLFGARDNALRQALLLDLRKRSAHATPEQIQTFYEQNRSRYETPAAILIWRIRVASEADARGLLAQLDPPNESKWSLLAREHSTDDATNMRAGSLGYVEADGQTHMPELRISPALFAAAAALKDGELLRHPIPDAGGFALLWRRASHPASVRPLREVSTEISHALLDVAVASDARALIEQLRQRDLHDYAPALLSGFEPRAPEVLEAHSNAASTSTPVAPRARRAVRLVPRETDLGLR
jgi:hypothetical protein